MSNLCLCCYYYSFNSFNFSSSVVRICFKRLSVQFIVSIHKNLNRLYVSNCCFLCYKNSTKYLVVKDRFLSCSTTDKCVGFYFVLNVLLDRSVPQQKKNAECLQIFYIVFYRGFCVLDFRFIAYTSQLYQRIRYHFFLFRYYLGNGFEDFP